VKHLDDELLVFILMLGVVASKVLNFKERVSISVEN